MEKEEIKKGIELLINTSVDVQGYYEDDQAMVDGLNQVPKEELEQCLEFYKSRSGVIIDLRKELIQNLYNGVSYTIQSLNELINKHKQDKENQFKSYTKLYSIFYPPLTFYGHEKQRDFIATFIDKLIEDLELKDKIKITKYDFQGARQQGSDRFWVALYNKAQENQSTGLQIFIEFHHGKINYGIFRHADKSYIKSKQQFDASSFDYEQMLNYFQREKDLILNDVPDYSNAKQIKLNGKRIYKMSHGSFKAKKYKPIIEAFKGNNWIAIHENTKKGQSEHFKNGLEYGDLVYITVGSNELIGIARVVSNEYSYVPNDIVDSDEWICHEVEMILPAVRKSPKDLKDARNFFPSGNSTLAEIKPQDIEIANELLFKPYFNAEIILEDETRQVLEKVNYNTPLNQIFYGPPGTGKTYNTILEAAKIIEQNDALNYSEAQTVFNINLGSRLEFITFHQNYSYEDFIQGLRPDIEQKALSFNRADGIFTKMVINALFEYYKVYQNIQKLATNTVDVNIDLNDAFIEFMGTLEEGQVFKTKTGGTVKVDNFTDRQNIEFRPINGVKSYLVSGNRLLKLYKIYDDINKIKRVNEDIRQAIGGCNSTMYYVALREFIEFLKKYKESVEEFVDDEEEYVNISYRRKKELLSHVSLEDLRSVSETEVPKYVIIIDEINRANISRVFGELITLIEKDKRSHGQIPLSATLPSGEKFIVPSNLYIVGTMNTADKSIALLDIALRRRFEFVPMYPNSQSTDNKIVNDATILDDINKEIISRKGHDFTIGHSYFMGEDYDLKNTINNKVIPLLLEYFMNDFEEVKKILGAANIKVDSWPLQYIAND